MSKATDALVVALESVPEVQQRIDLVAEDVTSGKNKYAKIDAWKLGELLGVDWDDHGGDCFGGDYAYRHELEDAGFDRPFAENVHLLDGQVPKKRYAKLAALASSIQSHDKDLSLTQDEIVLIREAYVEAAMEEQGSVVAALCYKTVTSTKGVELTFTAGVGDGGEAFDAKSPCDDGDCMDPAVFVKIDD